MSKIIRRLFCPLPIANCRDRDGAAPKAVSPFCFLFDFGHRSCHGRSISVAPKALPCPLRSLSPDFVSLAGLLRTLYFPAPATVFTASLKVSQRRSASAGWRDNRTAAERGVESDAP